MGYQKKIMHHVLQRSEPMRPMVYCKVFDPPMCLDVFKYKYRTPASHFASFDIINGKNLNAKSTISRTLSIYLQIFYSCSSPPFQLGPARMSCVSCVQVTSKSLGVERK